MTWLPLAGIWPSPPAGVPVLGWHPLDPPEPHRAAPLLGRLVASGLRQRGWAMDGLLHAAERLRKPGFYLRLVFGD